MNKTLIIFALLCLVACDDNEAINIETLENSGYKETKCNDIVSYTQDNENIIEVNSKLPSEKSFLLARCFNEDVCFIYVNVDTNNILCQRYIIDLDKQDKRDYFNSSYKEFDDHTVFYRIISKDSIKDNL